MSKTYLKFFHPETLKCVLAIYDDGTIEVDEVKLIQSDGVKEAFNYYAEIQSKMLSPQKGDETCLE